MRDDAGQHVAVERERQREDGRDDEDADEHEGLPVGAVGRGEHQRRGDGAHAGLEEGAEEELLDDHRRYDDQDADGQGLGHEPHDRRRDLAAGSRDPGRAQHVPETDHDEKRHDRQEPPRKADQESGGEIRGRARAAELQEIPQGALPRKGEVARQEQQEDHVDREERHEREVLRLRDASGQAAGKRERDRQQENRREKSERRVAPPRLREAVEREGRAGARPGEADDNACAPAYQQQAKDQTIHSPGIPLSLKCPGEGSGAAASRKPPTGGERAGPDQSGAGYLNSGGRAARGETGRRGRSVIPAG